MPNLKVHDFKKFSIIFFGLLVLFLFRIGLVSANNLTDTDKDGVPDQDEINIYKTNPGKADTDGDGFNDREELIKGFSPLNPQPIKLENNDYDHDGLSDRMELNFHTDLTNPDSDNDGFKDGEEIKKGYDPLKSGGARLEKKIEINLAKQELSYFLSDVKMNAFPVSSGVRGTTPTGKYIIKNKSQKAWSSYGLWMPYWLGIEGERFGIHELPIWPNGYREGADHLGTPVSHGCVRLGIGPAKELYDWAAVGTPVYIN
jgi:hypothetical protein